MLDAWPPRFVAAGGWPFDSDGPVLVDSAGEGLACTPLDRVEGRLPWLDGVLAPGVVDEHVHLGLADTVALRASAVVAVTDCGWDPVLAGEWRRSMSGLRVRALGPFHTPRGGYPKGRSWAPDAAVQEVGSIRGAEKAVADVVARGLDGVKVVVHAAHPWPLGVLETLVGSAHAAGLEVHAHAEGEQAAERALETHVDVLVHVPWSERLSDRVIVLAAQRTRWVSTLAVHDAAGTATAIDNARRFVAAGGTLRYGTDMGNGATPAGVHRRELALLATVITDPAVLLRATVGTDRIRRDSAIWSDAPRPSTSEAVVDWLARARRLKPNDLELR